MVNMRKFSTEMGKHLHPQNILELKYLLKDMFPEDAFGQSEDNGEDLEIILEQSNILEDELGRKLFKRILKEIGRYDWVTKLDIYLAIESHFTIFNKCAYICHMQNEDRRTLLTNISDMTRDEKKTLEINRGAGTVGKEYIKLAGWKDECTMYFASYYKSLDVITVPSDRDNIMTTLYELCSRNAGRGFIFKNYDMINHLEFLGYDKKLLAKNFMTRLTTNFPTYLAYIEQKKVILICGKTANSYNSNQCVEHIVTSIKCFLTLYGEIIQVNGITVIGILIRENEKEYKSIRCKFCELFSTSHIAFESTDNFLTWWKPIETFHNWWDLDGSQRISIRKDDRNESLFDILAAEILGFMAAVMIPTIPSLTKDATQQLRQTYLLYTPQQMNAYFSDNKHVVIQGSYGSGKSILGLKKLELVWKNLKQKQQKKTKNEIIFYVNYDNKSQLHTQMEINVREVLRIFSRNVQCISNFEEMSKLRDSTVYVWQNKAGEKLSTILEKFTGMEKLKMVKVNVIVEEYDGETLTRTEAAHIKKLIKMDNFKESHVIILQQPLTKKRSWSVGKHSYERESCMFQELEGPFKIIKLEKTLRCTNEIYNLTKFTQNLVKNKESVFPTDIDKLKPPLKQASVSAESNSEIFSNPESTIPSKDNVRSDPNKIDEPLEQPIDLDLDHAFKNLSVLQNRDGAKSKIVSNFGFVCEPQKGLDITEKTPKLIEFSEQIDSTSNIAVIALTLAINEFISENKKTTLLYTSDKEPKILRMAIDLFPLIISKVCKSESIEEYEVTYTDSLEEYFKNKETRMVFVSNFRSVNGMEFDNVLILLNCSEYYLKHFLPQMISRCNCNLNFILLPKEKESVKRTSSLVKLFLRSKSVEEKFTVGSMIEEWKRESLVESCEWDYRIIECQRQTCKEERKCYCISIQTDDLFTVHLEYYENHLSAHNKNLTENEQAVDTCGSAEDRVSDFIMSLEQQNATTKSLQREENNSGGARPRPIPAVDQVPQAAPLRDGRILHEVAAGKRKLDTMELRGVFDVNCRDDYGATPILTAIRNENVAFVEILLANGADINMKDKRHWNAKQLANFYGKNIKKLIDDHDRNANRASENQ